MNKLFTGVAAAVTVGALVLIGCPDDSTGGGGGFTQLGRCEAPASGNSSVLRTYADGDYTACSSLPLLAESPFGARSESGTATFTEINDGANGTSKALSMNVTTGTDGLETAGMITFKDDINVSGKALRFSVRSPASADGAAGLTGGIGIIRVGLETVGQTEGSSLNEIRSYRTNRNLGVVFFVNDGTWQEVAINFNEDWFSFAGSNITATTVRSIAFNLAASTNGDANGFGVQTFDIDEVRFEEVAPNCTAPAAGTASSVDLIWGDVAYNNCAAISSTGFYGMVHVPTRNAESRPRSPFAFLSGTLGRGVSGSPLFTNITLGSGHSTYAYGIADFNEDYDATGKALKFSIKSPAADSGGINNIDIFFEGETGGPGARTNTVNQTFTNNGTWQTVSVPISSFTFSAPGVSLATIRRVVFSLVDSDGLSTTGVGAQTLDIDEIRFE